MTVRESEFTARDRALMVSSWEEQHEPRGPHGVSIAEATAAENSPFSDESLGRFVAEPVVDFAQYALDTAREERRKSLRNPDDDPPLLWRVRREERSTPSET